MSKEKSVKELEREAYDKAYAEEKGKQQGERLEEIKRVARQRARINPLEKPGGGSDFITRVGRGAKKVWKPFSKYMTAMGEKTMDGLKKEEQERKRK